MQHLKWFILAVFATVVAEGRYIRPVRELKVPNWIDFRKGETSVDTHIPPAPPLYEVFAKPKREDLVENGDLVEDKRNKNRRVVTVSNPLRIGSFAKFKDEIKRSCRPRPGSAWCTGKREILEDKETVNTDELTETIPEELSWQN